MDREATHQPISLPQGPALWTSVRARLLLLILLAIVPALGLALYTGLEHRRMASVQAQHEALRLARIASNDHEGLIEAARQLLVALSSLPSVRTRHVPTCNAYFADLLKRYRRYANLGVIEADGNIVCSALPLSHPVNAAGRTYFRRAVETRDFAVGDYQIGSVTGRATINFGYPILDSAGQVQGVVFAALDLAWLNQLVVQARLPPGSVMSVIDSNGTVLARHPDPEQWAGRSARELPIVKTVLAQGEGVVEAPGLDGVPRLFGFTTLHSTPRGPDMYIRIGIPRSAAYAEADRLLARSLIGLGLVGALTLVVAWVFADRFVLRGVRTLMRGAERLKAGDLTARVEVTGRGELSTLAVRFNEMADGLQEAYGQLAAHVRELKRQTQELNLLRTIDLMLLADAPLQDLLDKAVEACALTAGSKTCVLVTVGPEGGALTPVATFGPDLEGIRQYFATLKPRVGEEGGALARAIARRAPVVISDIPSSAEMERYRDLCARLGIRAALAVPLATDHRVLGAVGIGYPTARSFSEAEIATIQGIAGQLAVAVEQARLREEAKQRRQLEVALRDSETRRRVIEEASRHKSEFLNNMAHELRTPLNSIIGFSEILRDPAFGALTDKQARFAHNILTAGEHLLVLINDLLDLSRVEAGKIDLRPESFVLPEALEAAVTEIRPQADRKQLDVQLDLEAAPSTIVADPVRVKQILLNLLSNAVKFTPDGGRITIAARRDPYRSEFVDIVVTDTGIGIKPDDLPRLFHEFIRLDAAAVRQIQGTGLGLVLTKKLVELHGGTIAAASDGEGRGSTFTVRLPLAARPE